jgi:hypothetical protein
MRSAMTMQVCSDDWLMEPSDLEHQDVQRLHRFSHVSEKKPPTRVTRERNEIDMRLLIA